MAITVKDIREKDFTAQKHGYSIEEVDDFLDGIADQVGQLIQENRTLKEQLKNASPAPEPIVIEKESAKAEIDDSDYFKNLESAMRDTLLNAQRYADETRKAADKEASATVADANAKAEQIMADAQAEAQVAKGEAQAARDQISKYRSDFRALIEEQVNVLKTRESLFD